MNLKLIRLQSVIFLSQPYFSGKDKLIQINEFKSKLADIPFNEPVVLPVLDDMPLEIPRFILNSSDGYSLNGSANRIDLFTNVPEGQDIENDFTDRTKKVFSILKDNPKCNRLAQIFLFQSTSQDSVKDFREYFMSSNIPETTNEIHVAYNEVISGSPGLNKFVAVDFINGQGNIQFDINLIPDPSLKVTDTIFDNFFKKAQKINQELIGKIKNV